VLGPLFRPRSKHDNATNGRRKNLRITRHADTPTRSAPAVTLCLPTPPSGSELSRPDRLTEVIIHPCSQALFAFSPHRVGCQGDDVNRRLPWARQIGAVFQLAYDLSGLVAIHFRHLAVHENDVVWSALQGLQYFPTNRHGIGAVAHAIALWPLSD
jgi:hypothetical protein